MGYPASPQNFFGILERYNPLTGTFFTPVGEMGLALHELHEVSGLATGDSPQRSRHRLYAPKKGKEEMLMNEGLHGFLLPPDLKNTIALSQQKLFRCLRHTSSCT